MNYIDEISKFVSYNELKELIKDEEFVPVDFPTNIHQQLSKREKKVLDKNLQVSKYWVCIRGVYIPKKMISSVHVQYLERIGNPPLRFMTIENATVHLGYFALLTPNYKVGHFAIATRSIARYLREGKDIPTLKKPYSKWKEYYDLYKTVETKEDFIQFITSE